MPVINIDHQRIYYEVTGSGEPLVCVAGFTADHHVWDGIVSMLCEYYQVIVLDNPGVGQSSTPEQAYDIEQFAKIVLGLCDHLAIDRANFLGNSMGGAIVQQLAYSYPDRVKKAVISNSFMNLNNLAYARFAKAAELLFTAGLPQAQVMELVLPWAFSAKFLTLENTEKLIEFAVNNPYPQMLAGYQFQLKALLGFDSTDWVEKIHVPCLFIAGDEDAISFFGQIKTMADQVQHGEYYLFEGGVGHLPHVEQPILFVEKLIEFLR